MKTMFIIISMLLIISKSTSQTRFQITGEVYGLEKGTPLYLVLNQSGDTLSKTLSNGGKFIFKGNLGSVIEWASIRIKGINVWPTFFIEPGSLKIKGQANEWSNATLIGSRETNIYYEFKRIYEPLVKKINTTSDSVEKDAVTKKLQISMERFISIHPNSIYSAWLIQHATRFTRDKKKEEFDKLTERVKRSHFAVDLLNEIRSLNLREVIQQGLISPDFIVQTKEGNFISLKNIVRNSRLTLIDFWASWCKPCREAIPELKKTYVEFKDSGLSILSVSSDKSRLAWLKASDQEKILWTNTRLVENEVSPLLIYDIQAIPAFILLDSVGRILAIHSEMSSIKSFGFNEEQKDFIYLKVQKLLGQKDE